MSKHFSKAFLPLLGVIALTGCIDDNYDLDNIDKTSEIKVNNLVVPVNVDKITLEQVMDIDKDDPDGILKVYTSNGQTFFAIEKSGDFGARSIYVNKVNAPSAKGLPTVTKEIEVPSGFSFNEALPVPEMENSFEYNIEDVDRAIVNLKDLTLDKNNLLNMRVTFSSNTLSQAGATWAIENLIIKVPEGFSGNDGFSSIDEFGYIVIPNGINSNNGAFLDILIDYLRLSGTENYPDGIYNDNGNVNITGSVAIVGGDLKIYGITSLPSSIDLSVNFQMGPFTVDAFSGEINYEVDAPSIEPLNLEGLPDFLKGPETKITLVNPQIYMSMVNEVGNYGVDLSSVLTITPWRENEDYSYFGSVEFSIGYNGNDPYNIVIAPYPFDSFYKDIQNYYRYEELNKVLYGDGLPQSISFELDHPAAKGETRNFPLGQNFSFEGTYKFFTPLQLEAGSVIHYVKEEKDWFDGDVDKLTIDKLTLSAIATTDLPFDVILSAYPYVKDDKTGEVFLDRENQATAIVKAGSTNEILFDFPKQIESLDGVYFETYVYMQSEQILNPDNYIVLDRIRARVSGKYVTEF